MLNRKVKENGGMKLMRKVKSQWVTISAAGLLAGALAPSSVSAWTARTVSEISNDVGTVSTMQDLSSYQLRWGDTLWGLSQATNFSVMDLATAFNIENPDLIYAGNQLGDVTVTEDDRGDYGEFYTVVAGDTLSAIAQAHNTTVARLVELNAIANPDLIFPGQVLKVSDLMMDELDAVEEEQAEEEQAEEADSEEDDRGSFVPVTPEEPSDEADDVEEDNDSDTEEADEVPVDEGDEDEDAGNFEPVTPEEPSEDNESDDEGDEDSEPVDEDEDGGNFEPVAPEEPSEDDESDDEGEPVEEDDESDDEQEPVDEDDDSDDDEETPVDEEDESDEDEEDPVDEDDESDEDGEPVDDEDESDENEEDPVDEDDDSDEDGEPVDEDDDSDVDEETPVDEDDESDEDGEPVDEDDESDDDEDTPVDEEDDSDEDGEPVDEDDESDDDEDTPVDEEDDSDEDGEPVDEDDESDDDEETPVDEDDESDEDEQDPVDEDDESDDDEEDEEVEYIAPNATYELSYDEDTHTMAITVTAGEMSNGLLAIALPDGTDTTDSVVTYTASQDGTYLFAIIDNEWNIEQIQVTVEMPEREGGPIIDPSLPAEPALAFNQRYVEFDHSMIIEASYITSQHGFSHMILPDGTTSSLDYEEFKVFETGEYIFEVYDTAGNMREHYVFVEMPIEADPDPYEGQVPPQGAIEPASAEVMAIAESAGAMNYADARMHYDASNDNLRYHLSIDEYDLADNYGITTNIEARGLFLDQQDDLVDAMEAAGYRYRASDLMVDVNEYGGTLIIIFSPTPN